MDPSATLRSILEKLDDLHVDPGHREESVYLLRKLARWLENGGHSPNVEETISKLADTYK